MKFYLIDRVEEISATRVVGVKHVSLAEEYLQDHFPTFPVLPGVMMIEAGVQACAWLLQHRYGFARPMAVLREAKNVRYGHFVSPGQVLRIEAEWVKAVEGSGSEGGTGSESVPAGAVFKVGGTVVTDSGEKNAFTARLELSYFSLTQRRPALGHLDEGLIRHARERWVSVAPKAEAVKTGEAVALS